MKRYHYIDAGNDKFGNHHILWQVADYTYVIEDVKTKKVIELDGTGYETALTIFHDVLTNF